MGRFVHRLIIIVLALLGVLLAPQDALCQRKRDRSKDKENDSLKQIVVDYTLSDSDRERVQSGIKLANYYLNENDPQCVEQANATIKIATKCKMNTEVGELYGIIGSYYSNNKNYKKAKEQPCDTEGADLLSARSVPPKTQKQPQGAQLL